MDVNEERGFSVGGSVGEENYFLGYTFTDRSHSCRVVKSIMDLSLEDGLFADVTITVDGKEFHLHRLVLSAQSSFFRSMFTSNLKESYNRSIELKDVSANVFQLLIGYIYHGTIKLRVEELQDTYEMADMYHLTSLFEECSRFLSRTVEVKNCLQVILSCLIRSGISPAFITIITMVCFISLCPGIVAGRQTQRPGVVHCRQALCQNPFGTAPPD